MVVFVAGAGLLAYTLLRLWSDHAGQPSAKPIDWATAIFVTAVSLVVVTGWVGLLLATLGWFSLTSLGFILIAVALVLWRKTRTLRLHSFLPVSRYEVLLGVLLLVCSVVYFRPHEYVLGGADAGGYMNIGSNLARTGQLVMRDDWTRLLSDFGSITLREQPPSLLTRHLQFVGWYIDDADPARGIPQFFAFHPTLIAVGVSLAGVQGGLLVTPLWGVLGLAAVYFAIRQCFGARTGLLSTTFLAVTPTHIYFARYPTAEAFTLLLIFSGLLAYQRLRDDEHASAVWGVFGGATFGAAFLTRIDLPLLAVLIVVALLAERIAGRWHRAWTAFAITLGALTLHTILYAVFVAWPYTWNTYSSALRIVSQSPQVVVSTVLGSATLLLAGFTMWRHRARLAHSGSGHFLWSDGFRWFLIGLVVMLSIYAYFLRPLVEPTRYADSWPSGNSFPILNGQNWVRLGWYLTPLGLILATGGLAVILRRESLKRLGLFLAVGVLTTIQYVYNIFNTPYQIYAMRRYVPVVIPVLVVYAAYAVVTVCRARSVRYGRLLGVLLSTFLLGGMLYQSRYVLPQRDFYGALEQITALNDKLKPDAIVVISEPSQSVFADTFGVPLRFMFGHDIATIRQDGPGVQAFLDRLLTYAADHGRPVQLIAVDPVASAVRDGLSLQQAEMIPVTLHMLMNTFDDYPSVIQMLYYGIEVYDVAVRSAALPEMAETLIDIGTFDSLYIRSGFYYKETVGATTGRWTSGEATVDVPAGTSSITLDLRAIAFRPEQVPVADVAVWLDGQLVGHLRPEDTWREFTLQAQPHPLHGMSTLRFTTEAFTPVVYGINADTRDLGFFVDWIRISAQ